MATTPNRLELRDGSSLLLLHNGINHLLLSGFRVNAGPGGTSAVYPGSYVSRQRWQQMQLEMAREQAAVERLLASERDEFDAAYGEKLAKILKLLS